MHDTIVIGTGHAGVAASQELARLGHRPLVIDIGRTLDDSTARAVDRLRRLSPPDWDAATLDHITRNHTTGEPLPRQLAFGSEHMYGQDGDELLPTTRAQSHAPAPSPARGGRSNAWGAAMLPAHDCDMAGWPITRADLAPHYRRVLQTVPLSGARDGLEEEFPLYRSTVDQLSIPPVAQLLLDRLERSQSSGTDDVVVGRSRLAVTGDPESPNGCRYCGLCHSGCVYGSIDSAATHLDRLEASEKVSYRPGLVARSITESGTRVVVQCDRVDGGTERLEASRVFVAAGAIGSARLALESLEMWDQSVRLASTHGFIAPILVARPALPWPNSMTLASFFIEMKVAPSPHWIHVQVSPPNELAMAKLLQLARQHRSGERALQRLSRHLLVALCGMHSNLGGHHLLTLSRNGAGPPRLTIDTIAQPSFPGAARTAARRLRHVLGGAGAITLGPMASTEPVSWHFGSSLPMRHHPATPLETDVLGRPSGLDRTHFVDASVLPAVPATTIALLTMANCTRIVHDAMGG